MNQNKKLKKTNQLENVSKCPLSLLKFAQFSHFLIANRKCIITINTQVKKA